jgi:hypothetical protein
MDRIEDRAVILDLLVSVCRMEERRLASRGLTLEIALPADNGPRRAVKLDAESERGLAQLMLWETGELDLVIGDALSGEVLVDEHREVFSEVGIKDALATN